MDSGTAVPELKRLIGGEGRSLLRRFNLLRPLMEQMVLQDAISDVTVTDELLEEGQLGLLQQRGYEGMDDWPELLNQLERTNEEVLERLRFGIRRRTFMRERFSAKAEARFLERKMSLTKCLQLAAA